MSKCFSGIVHLGRNLEKSIGKPQNSAVLRKKHFFKKKHHKKV